MLLIKVDRKGEGRLMLSIKVIKVQGLDSRGVKRDTEIAVGTLRWRDPSAIGLCSG